MTDAELVRAAQAGDVVCLGMLLERHRALLHAIAVGMLGHGPQAEDAIHDAFLVALRRIGELRDPGAARAWLAAICANQCRMALRRPAPVLFEPHDAPAEPAVPAVEDAIEGAAVREWVWTALGRLSEPLRLAVLLRYFSGASSYDAIAQLSGVPVGTVRSRLSAARAQLADELLATAAAAFTDTTEWNRRAAEAGLAMERFTRTGDRTALDDVLDPDLEFALFDRVVHRGRERFAQLVESDMEDGVTARPARVISGPDVAIVELWLDSPADQPLHCPPATTWVHFHGGGRTHRLRTHYAPRP